jgi:hypothetical protein
MNSCEQRVCPFWDIKNRVCTDDIDYINALNGGLCCRYHPNAMYKDDYEREFGENN